MLETRIRKSFSNQRAATAALLLALTALFVLRVVGQVLVAFCGVTFLPTLDQWDSGLISYPILLSVQCVLIVLMVYIARSVSSAQGFFGVPRPKLGRFLRSFGVIYFLSMLARYAITMTFYPERRWFGYTIPIVFHFVLATFVLVLARLHLRGAAPAADARGNARQTAAPDALRGLPSYSVDSRVVG
jgi:hypothetical protein